MIANLGSPSHWVILIFVTVAIIYLVFRFIASTRKPALKSNDNKNYKFLDTYNVTELENLLEKSVDECLDLAKELSLFPCFAQRYEALIFIFYLTGKTALKNQTLRTRYALISSSSALAAIGVEASKDEKKRAFFDRVLFYESLYDIETPEKIALCMLLIHAREHGLKYTLDINIFNPESLKNFTDTELKYLELWIKRVSEKGLDKMICHCAIRIIAHMHNVALDLFKTLESNRTQNSLN